MATQQPYILRFIRNSRETFREHWLAYLFVFPTLLYLVFLWWAPFLWGVRMSFYNWPLFGESTFVGLGNYAELFGWDAFWTSVWATVIYGVQTIPHLIIGTGAALLVWDQDRFAGIISVMFLVPYILPPLITGTLWRHLLSPDLGPIFGYLVNFGILQQPIYWSIKGSTALAAITLIGTWTFWPLVFLLVISSLRGIPSSHIETAKVYGANRWERFRYVTFPQIKTALLIAVILRIIWNLGKIDQPFQITRGEPGFSTSVLGVLLYRIAWVRQEMGLAFAVGIILAIISLAFVIGFMFLFERQSEEVRLG